MNWFDGGKLFVESEVLLIAAVSPRPSLRSQESLPRPPIHPLTDTYGSFEPFSLVNSLSNVACATHICGVDRGFISGGGSILPISALTCGSPPVGSAFRRGPLFNHLN